MLGINIYYIYKVVFLEEKKTLGTLIAELECILYKELEPPSGVFIYSINIPIRIIHKMYPKLPCVDVKLSTCYCRYIIIVVSTVQYLEVSRVLHLYTPVIKIRIKEIWTMKGEKINC